MKTPREVLAELNPDAVFLNEHESALVGVVWLPKLRPVAHYDAFLLGDSIQRLHPNMTEEEVTDLVDEYERVTDNDPIVDVVDVEGLGEEDTPPPPPPPLPALFQRLSICPCEVCQRNMPQA